MKNKNLFLITLCALFTGTCSFAVKERMHFITESGSSSPESKSTIYSNQANLDLDDLFSASEMLEKLKMSKQAEKVKKLAEAVQEEGALYKFALELKKVFEEVRDLGVSDKENQEEVEKMIKTLTNFIPKNNKKSNEDNNEILNLIPELTPG